MMIEDFGFTGVDEKVIKKEKAKARDLRRTSWWKNKIATGSCHFCGKKFPAKELTMDHLIPLARGGTSSKGNVVAACKECNTKKKILLPLEWEEYMSSLDRRER